MQSALTNRLDRRLVIERQELRQQSLGTAVGQQSAYLGDDTFIFRRASVRHDLGDWAERSPAGHGAPAGSETRGADLDGAE
jgi:hypothetical protein